VPVPDVPFPAQNSRADFINRVKSGFTANLPGL
jgi:hypothetical protein